MASGWDQLLRVCFGAVFGILHVYFKCLCTVGLLQALRNTPQLTFSPLFNLHCVAAGVSTFGERQLMSEPFRAMLSALVNQYLTLPGNESAACALSNNPCFAHLRTKYDENRRHI